MSKSAIVLAIPMLACIACGIVFSWHPVFTAVATFTSGVISAAGLGLRRQRLLVEWYLRRPTLYHAWITRYGADRKEQIKRFLRIYADAFFVDAKIIHKLGPDDDVMDFYLRAHEPGEPDAMESETFVSSLQNEFGYTAEFSDGEITLGALFEKVTKMRNG